MGGILGARLGQGGSDGLKQRALGAGLGGAQRVLHFAPHLFDRVEVRGVGGEEERFGSGGGDQGQGGFVLVRGEVVNDDQINGT